MMPGNRHHSRYTSHRIWESDKGGETHNKGSWTPRPVISITFAALGSLNLKLHCLVCGHERILHSAALLWIFEARGWDDRLADLAPRFRCVPCWLGSGRKVRPLCAFVDEDPTGAALKLPDEREWKRFTRRVRS